MTRATLLDVAKHNLGDSGVGLIEEATNSTPELQLMPVKTIGGLNYYTKVRTSLPVASFRSANEGNAAVKSTFENRLVETFILNPRWEADKAVADRAEEGVGQFLADEAMGILQAGFLRVAKSLYYGNDAAGLLSGYQIDAKGFPGLIDIYDSANMEVDATGAAADTGSSVWAIRLGRRDTQLVMGQNGSLDISDPRIETLYDDNNNPFTGYVQELLGYPGLQVGTIQSVGRIKNLTAEAGKGLTDALLSQLLRKFPEGREPNVLLMSRRSKYQLRDSRTATTETGKEAPLPMEFDGVPIITTEGIQDTEPIV